MLLLNVRAVSWIRFIRVHFIQQLVKVAWYRVYCSFSLKVLLVFGRLHAASFLSREDHLLILTCFSWQRVSSNLFIAEAVRHAGDARIVLLVFRITAKTAHFDRFESGCECQFLTCSKLFFGACMVQGNFFAIASIVRRTNLAHSSRAQTTFFRIASLRANYIDNLENALTAPLTRPW